MRIIICFVVLLACSSINALTVDEQLLQLRDSFFEMRGILEEKNSRMDALELQVAQLEAKVIQLERVEIQNKMLMEEIALLQKKVRTTDIIDQPSMKAKKQMPTSCADLSAIGHTLNGLYSVIGNKSVESVYCDFTNSPNDPGFQTWLGHIDVKSSPAYFFVRRNQTFDETRTPIVFDIEWLNEGAAYDKTTGIFTAPAAGIYFFSVTGTAAFPASFFSSRLFFQIGLFQNDQVMAYAMPDEVDAYYQYETFALQTTLDLIKGDQISVRIQSMSEGPSLVAGMYTQFNGFLLEEDISQSLTLY
ncbi:C1q and tumor necrosis factor-related protein-like protein 3 isoform b [Daphnia sinensis]|uniref:C1q and tumor necrosis factor-related protein-like protein 3 isoform b n=1 Tax=Daphnia sinensis TaxID=1820382 RepID=A0AAD5L8P7_9CRUS|nr:C1q and tumor necrosis factor-related protein-like protein 3 isoform b [Daphnia sinensis]